VLPHLDGTKKTGKRKEKYKKERREKDDTHKKRTGSPTSAAGML
jgi:hypothetical protein